jgi:hypothetical protein
LGGSKNTKSVASAGPTSHTAVSEWGASADRKELKVAADGRNSGNLETQGEDYGCEREVHRESFETISRDYGAWKLGKLTLVK